MLKILNPKLLLLVLAIALGFLAWQSPQSIPNQKTAEFVQQFKSSQSGSEVTTIELNTPYLVDQAQKVFASFTQNTTLPSEITGLPEEVVVEDAVSSLTQELKKLPAKEAIKFKTEFCQDVINQHTASVAGAVDQDDQ